MTVSPAAAAATNILPPINSAETLSRKRRSSEATNVLSHDRIVTPAMPLQQSQLHSPQSLQRNAVSIKVRLKRFHAVAAWTWNANDHVCGICQSPFEGVCPGVKYPGEDCPVVWGKCGHAFHLQCVSKWLSQTASKNSCPICRQEWEFGQNPVNTTTATSAAEGTENAETASTSSRTSQPIP